MVSGFCVCGLADAIRRAASFLVFSEHYRPGKAHPGVDTGQECASMILLVLWLELTRFLNIQPPPPRTPLEAIAS